jgi:hypothetical protein
MMMCMQVGRGQEPDGAQGDDEHTCGAAPDKQNGMEGRDQSAQQHRKHGLRLMPNESG